MKSYFKYIFLIILTLNVAITSAQERENDSIDGGTVTVVKPYTPKISDAFKIREIPTLNDSTTVNKKVIKYNIFSIPVASTFTPAKGKAATVDKEKSVKLYDNYASLGVGSYTTILGEVYLNHAISRTERVGGYFSHHSSAGDIEGVNFDNNFSETGLNAHYTQKQRNYSWKVEGGFQLQRFNWYGLPDQDMDVFDVGHSFYTANIGGNIQFDDAIINKGSVLYRRFGDDQDSGENRFLLKTGFDVPVADEVITTEVTIDYLGGSFDKSYFGDEDLNYSNIILGLAPSYQMKQDDLTLNLGVNLVYLNDTEASDGRFFIYPNITASYRLVDELLIAYGSIEGGLNQNSYYDFAQENPFVSPTLFIVPTDQAYNASVGVKGKLSNSISYNVNGRYSADNNRALFRSNAAIGDGGKSYQFGNSFGIAYDDVKTFAIGGELNVDINRNFKLGLKADYFAYTTENEAEAWNLPDIEASAFLDIQIDEHWFAGANLFFVGERKDILIGAGGPLIMPTATQVTLKSYFDANANVGYKITNQLSAFVKANNIANQNYNRWVNYPVQGIQFLAGATYQFDF
ncbi:TonB-dependent receptor [Psychroserpens burtonensis]|uniref:TonB-dependent receptor n=1 Tax=Psychroserpens burtonensis TaxID=49278 RepID=A0A5C7B5D9_9FLAO|nr:TonB-dependent receptor [Psychroserpens burtonensis]TXE15610.1 TonB-dependent receptor [Psychroserpens burtonensis]